MPFPRCNPVRPGLCSRAILLALLAAPAWAGPPPVRGSLDEETVRSTASILIARQGDAIIGTVRGTSMEPVLQNGTVIVLKKTPFAKLQAGMDVGYANSQGTQVIHRLVRKKGSYWVARGINNSREDRDLVTPENYLGTLYAVFYSLEAAETSLAAASEGPSAAP